MEGCRRLPGGAQVGGRNALVLGVSPRQSLGTSSLANQTGKHVPSQVGNKVYESPGTEEDSCSGTLLVQSDLVLGILDLEALYMFSQTELDHLQWVYSGWCHKHGPRCNLIFSVCRSGRSRHSSSARLQGEVEVSQTQPPSSPGAPAL